MEVSCCFLYRERVASGRAVSRTPDFKPLGPGAKPCVIKSGTL